MHESRAPSSSASLQSRLTNAAGDRSRATSSSGSAVHADPRHPRACAPTSASSGTSASTSSRRSSCPTTASLDFDLSPDGELTYPPDEPPSARPASNPPNSTVLRDGILPGYQAGQLRAGRTATTGSRTRRRPGPSSRPHAQRLREPRRGPDVGDRSTRRRDDTRPTWTLAFDAKLDVVQGHALRSARIPNGNTAVGLGYHQFVWSTCVEAVPLVRSVFRRLVHAAGAHQRQPVPEVPERRPDGVEPAEAGRRHGGVEQIAWENPRASSGSRSKSARACEQHFYGRGPSELWEPLAGSSQCDANQAAKCRPVIAGLRTTAPTTTGLAARPTRASPRPRPTPASAVTRASTCRSGGTFASAASSGCRSTCRTSSPPRARASTRTATSASSSRNPERGEPDLPAG